jgi:hypothetical protein
MKTIKITREQRELINQHQHLANHFIIDKDGRTIYAKCSDGYVKITKNTNNNFIINTNERNEK